MAVDWLSKNVGDPVNNGHIGHIYYASTDYIVYVTKEDPTELCHNHNDRKIEENVNRVLPLLYQLKRYFGNTEEKVAYFPEIAAIYKLCLENDIAGATSTANDLITHLRQQILARNNAQLRYQGICLSFMLINILFAMLLRYCFDMGKVAAFWEYFQVGVWGSFGGWLSVSIKMNRNSYDLTASSAIQTLSAISRMFIAIISAVIIHALVEAHVVLGILSNLKGGSVGKTVIYSLAAASGFSESLVPDLLNVLSKKGSGT